MLFTNLDGVFSTIHKDIEEPCIYPTITSEKSCPQKGAPQNGMSYIILVPFNVLNKN